MRITKIIIFAAFFWVILGLVKNLLVLTNIVNLESIDTILFSIGTALVLSFIYKHIYWIAACIFLSINEILKYIVKEIYTVNSVILSQTQDYIFILVGGMLSLILSLIFILIFLRTDYENYYLFKKQKT